MDESHLYMRPSMDKKDDFHLEAVKTQPRSIAS